MPKKSLPIEMVVEVRPEDANKRQSLTNGLDIGLLLNGFRIRAGSYRITIQRLSDSESNPEVAP